MDTIFLTLGRMMWKIELRWDGGSCKFGNGWYKFVKELNISTGDVINLNVAEAVDVVHICIFKKEELKLEKEEGKLSNFIRAYTMDYQCAVHFSYTNYQH